MAAPTLSYERLAKRLLTLPFVLTLLIACAIFSLNDMLQTIQNQVQQAKTINQLLARSAASNNSTLVSRQVEGILTNSNTIRSIMFFPVNATKQVNNDAQSLENYLTLPYFGISEPVIVQRRQRTTAPAPVNQLLGYMNITLDMQEIRRQWLKRIAPLWLAVFGLSLIPMLVTLARLRRLTQRIPILEELCEKVLHNQDIDIIDEDIALKVNDENSQSLIEKALFYLINKQKMQRHQIALLNAEQMDSRDKELKQVQQYSTFQNTITHEFKLSLERIQSGLQLLQNQYISNEQQDAVDIINLGTDDLNAKLNQIIQMMRIEKGQTSVELVQFSPTQLITDIVNDFQIAAREKEIILASKVYHADYILEGDAQKIKTILSSLVDNAIKFTEEGSVTLVSQLQHLERNIRWTIEVQDTGIGIDSKYHSQIFQPFFQVEPDRKHNLKNNNIGLFLTQKLAALISADINVVSQPDKGSTFSLSLVLDDWKNAYERTVLKGKHVAIWYEDKTIMNYAPRLGNAGAQIEGFTDEALLMQHLVTETVDALLISYKIPVNKVKSFIHILRTYETAHRILIIVYYHAKLTTPHELETLKIVGADYVENVEKVDIHIDDHIKRIVSYLN